MRSRYTAFFLQDEPYLMETWHPDHRPTTLELGGVRYTGLTVHEAQDDEVEFTVRMKLAGGREQRFRERSRFTRLGEQWVYLEGREVF